MPNKNWMIRYLNEAFQRGSVQDVSGGNDRLYITLEHWAINFEDMFRLSSVLGTKKIDIVDEHHFGGCDTCGHGEHTEYEIECNGVKEEMQLTDEPDHPEEKFCRKCGKKMRCYHLEVELFDADGAAKWAPMWKKYWQCDTYSCTERLIEEYDGVFMEETWD